MSDAINFIIDGKAVTATSGETIWQVANRNGLTIPHLCYAPEPDYRPDGNCRACMVEIKGERALQASCLRKPTEGMEVGVETARAHASRRMVFELLMADQPARSAAHDPDSKFWQWADRLAVSDSRFPAGHKPPPDISHPAMAVNLDACINCTLCVARVS
ncbi:MAG: 2Fe-2S iron-sulfur cluster-binding protein [Aliidongia sp.]